MSPEASQPAAPDAADVAVDAAPAETTPAPAEPELARDYSNLDAMIERAREAVDAEAAGDGSPSAATSAPPTDAAAAPEDSASPPDDAAAVEALKARGYEVTPPAPPPPPPDPYQELHQQLEPLVGTAEEYRAARDAALAPLPPLPGDTDPDWQAKFDAHAHAVAARDRAAAALARFDHGREVAGTARGWARQRVLGELGSALGGLPRQYGLSEEQALRVTRPQTMSDAVAAVVEARDAMWQARVDELTRHYEGEVKRAGVDRRAARMAELGGAPQPGAPAGGRPGGALAPIFEGTATPDDLTEDMIASMRRGGLARLTDGTGR